NYTNYFRGLNGLVVDMADLPGAPTASDFEFAVWNGVSVSGFVPLTASPVVSLIPGGGSGGSVRIKLEFADGNRPARFALLRCRRACSPRLPP
ncbi:MAG: hypothetical protein ACK53L_31170, partial [Pirellulaceae bacterium]